VADEGASDVVNARILYWGPPQAGVTQSLLSIRAKLRGGGQLREIPTRLDPTVSYELLPISLGKVGGVPTELQIIGVPASPEQQATRKQLLDRVDGLVFVADASPDRVEENVACMEELRNSLAAYGRDTSNLPIVVQCNKRDLADPFAIEALHRRLGLVDAAVFESVATEAIGVLQALTTVSKQVIRLRRDRVARAEPSEPAPVEPAQVEPVQVEPVQVEPVQVEPVQVEPVQVEPVQAEPVQAEPVQAEPLAVESVETPAVAVSDRAAAPREETLPQATALETAILSEDDDTESAMAAEQMATQAAELFDRPWEELADEAKQTDGARIGPDFQIVSVGAATRSGPRSVRVPLVLGNPEGETVSLALGIALDPVLDSTEE
jgi:signal recognition particle receptor subunit beta